MPPTAARRLRRQERRPPSRLGPARRATPSLAAPLPAPRRRVTARRPRRQRRFRLGSGPPQPPGAPRAPATAAPGTPSPTTERVGSPPPDPARAHRPRPAQPTAGPSPRRDAAPGRIRPSLRRKPGRSPAALAPCRAIASLGPETPAPRDRLRRRSSFPARHRRRHGLPPLPEAARRTRPGSSRAPPRGAPTRPGCWPTTSPHHPAKVRAIPGQSPPGDPSERAAPPRFDPRSPRAPDPVNHSRRTAATACPRQSRRMRCSDPPHRSTVGCRDPAPAPEPRAHWSRRCRKRTPPPCGADPVPAKAATPATPRRCPRTNPRAG